MSDSLSLDSMSLSCDIFCQIFEAILPWLVFVSGVFAIFSVFSRFLNSIFGDRFVLFGGFGSLIKRKFTDLLCKTNWGFKLMYKLGWAEPGVHFFDCGQHCHLCPKYAECSSELRKSSNS